METKGNKNGKGPNETKPVQTRPKPKPKPKASVKLRFMCQSNFYDYMGKRKQFIHFGVFLQMGYTRYYAELDGNEIMKYVQFYLYYIIYNIIRGSGGEKTF